LNTADAVGWLIDVISGAVTRYYPLYYNIRMELERRAEVLNERKIRIDD